MPTVPPRSIALAKTREDHAWRFRTLMVLGLLVAALMAAGAVATDWSEGLDMALGQIAGMAAPLILLGLVVWAACAWIGQRRS